MRAIRLLLATALAGLALVPSNASAHEGLTPSEAMIEALSGKIRDAGLEPETFLRAPVTLRTIGPDGTVTETSVLFEDAIAQLAAPVEGATISRRAAADGGSSVVANAGDVLHIYANFKIGSSALGYNVSTSAVVPATPPVTVHPAVFDVGGPVRNVRGGNYLFGLHTVGTVFGSNVDTSAGPYPVGWLPVVSGGVVNDSSLDFAGHAVVAQAEFCFFVFCAAAGAMGATGVTLFDNGTPVAFPTVP